MKYLVLALIYFFSFGVSFAQLSRKYKEHGDQLMASGDVQGALKNYRAGMFTDSSSVDLQYAYASALRLTNNYKKAAHYYKSVQASDRQRKYVVSNFYAGQMYKYMGQYKQAQKEIKRFLKRFKGDKTSYEFVQASNDIEHWNDLIHLMKDTLEITLSNQHKINTPFSEFSAFFENDTSLLFSTLRSDSMKKRLILDSSKYFSRIHRAALKNEWEGVGQHASFHEDEQVNLANAILTPKADYVYYSECNSLKCDIFRAKNNDGKWDDFEALPDAINLPGYTNTQPFLARINGYDILYFVSDRPGGYGKLDIWYSIAYSNGLYEEPRNLGAIVNSPGNELSPYYLNDELALYFSSDFHIGLGGFDVFRSVLINEVYNEPENMGIPINSSYNDMYFRYYNSKAVLTSNRIGSLSDQFENCCNDLYFFDYASKTKKPVVELSKLERINKLLPLRLYFHNDEPNPRTNDTLTSVLYSAAYANYLSKLSIYEREYSKGLSKGDKQEAEEDIALFFDNEVKLGFDDLKQALNLMHEVLKEGKSLELIIKGYASPLSKSDYNKRLTLRRIESVKNEIRYFESGVLNAYFESGKLSIRQFPFGEDRLSEKVSDDVNDKINAIYSRKAAFERRVEILAVKIE